VIYWNPLYTDTSRHDFEVYFAQVLAKKKIHPLNVWGRFAMRRRLQFLWFQLDVIEDRERILRDLSIGDSVGIEQRRIARLASSPITLRILAGKGDSLIRSAVVGNASSDDSVLSLLLNDPEPNIRSAIAKRLRNGFHIMGLLHDTDEDVRASVASNGNTFSSDLSILATDESSHVRRAAASNHATTLTVLASLACDVDLTVADTAKGTLAILASSSHDI